MSLKKSNGKVECYIRVPGGEARSIVAFNGLRAQREEIESRFGEPLDWQDLPGRQGCRICKELPGGWRSPELEWPEMQDRMIEALVRLDGALKKPIQDLKF